MFENLKPGDDVYFGYAFNEDGSPIDVDSLFVPDERDYPYGVIDVDEDYFILHLTVYESRGKHSTAIAVKRSGDKWLLCIKTQPESTHRNYLVEYMLNMEVGDEGVTLVQPSIVSRDDRLILEVFGKPGLYFTFQKKETAKHD